MITSAPDLMKVTKKVDTGYLGYQPKFHKGMTIHFGTLLLENQAKGLLILTVPQAPFLFKENDVITFSVAFLLRHGLRIT